MRLSLVTNFDINNDLRRFEVTCNAVFNGMSTDKLDLFKEGIKKTQENNVLLSLDELKEVLQSLLRFKKLQSTDKEKLKAATIN